MAIYPSGTIINNRFEVVQGPNEKPSLAGGMGLVYLCVDHAEDGKPVALKTFRPELLSNRTARDRFLREGTTWVELGYHPHIVRCYQVFKVDIGSEVFFVLELVAAAEGKKDASLRSWVIPGKPLPLEQALLFALHICRGMAYANNIIPGMVHRDLKPGNILIGRDGHARVTDFGLASAAKNLDSDWQMDNDTSSSHIRTQLTHGIAGTPMYMAPEQWAGEPLDERADIYAFGCILYEMICGSFAVTGKSLKEWEQSHCQGNLNVIPPHVATPVSRLLQRCLALDAANRYSGWTELANELTDIYPSISCEPVPEIISNVKDTPAERIAVGWSYNAMGISYQDISKFEVARDYFEKVLTIARQHSDCELEGAALGNLGSAYRQLGDARRAIEFYEGHLAIAREIGDRHGEGQALGNLGNAYNQLGDARRAIEFLDQALVIALDICYRHGEGAALGNLGNAYFQLGDSRRAIEFQEKRLAISREIDDRHGEGQALGDLGLAYAQLGDLNRAIEFFEQHLTIARDIGDRHGEGIALGNLGCTYYYLGEPHRAIKFHELGLSIAHEIGDRHGEGQTLGNLGLAYHQLGNPHRAIDYYEQRLAIAREIGDIMGVAETSYNMALLYQKDRSSESLEYAKSALAIFKRIGHKQYATKVQALINKIKGF